MVYKWKQESHVSRKISAQDAGELCHRLEQEGNLNAKALVDESRADTAPLHKAFEWRDSVAAEEYRKQQAREIIRSITVVTEVQDNGTDKAVQWRAFYNTDSEYSGQYENIMHIVGNDEKYALVLERAKRELKAFCDKYNDLNELQELLLNIREFIA